MATSAPSAHYLERHISAPHMSAPLGHTESGRPAGAVQTSATTGPISIPRRQHRQTGRRTTSSCASYPNRFNSGPPLNLIDEVQDYSPSDYLAKLPDDFQTPTIALTPPTTAVERGESLANHIYPLTTPYQPAFTPEGSYTPMTATSDSSLTTASTVLSEPMTRSNTNDVLCDSFDMFRMDSMSHMPKVDLPESDSPPVHDVDHAARLFSFSSLTPSGYQDDSQLSFSDDFSSQPPFPFSVEMKHSPSRESNASSVLPLPPPSSSGQSRMSRRVQEQNTHGKSRPLAPKMKRDDTSSSGELPKPKLVAVTAEDGTVKHKAEITRTPRWQPPRKTTFCRFCTVQPQGFHGEHELRRHIERHHAQLRRVWICKEESPNGTFLANCKACCNRKTYGANYNAAAHLRRAHFNPCKNKRGGRGKKSEGRGGKGGGNWPSMEQLKNWMYEELEMNVNGIRVVQDIMPDPTYPQPGLLSELMMAGGYEMNGQNDGFNVDDWNDLVTPQQQPEPSEQEMVDVMPMLDLSTDPLYLDHPMAEAGLPTSTAPQYPGTSHDGRTSTTYSRDVLTPTMYFQQLDQPQQHLYTSMAGQGASFNF